MGCKFILYGFSVACMRLEEYSNAKAALEIGASLAQGEIRFTNLMKECDQHITGGLLARTS